MFRHAEADVGGGRGDPCSLQLFVVAPPQSEGGRKQRVTPVRWRWGRVSIFGMGGILEGWPVAKSPLPAARRSR